ncbi:MAG: iron-sulfur cluster assembly scaffold protein [Deltaproteobacteria bacterium]|nr:iron-sulfur cluster assembly scaffold protein [Deltaproteobacteria bacterium]
MGLYTDKILEHARHPRKFGRIMNPHLQFEEVNPLCGDRIRVELRLTEKSEVMEARFSGEMCAIAKGSASILFESVEGMTPAAIRDISEERILENLGGPIRSNRVKCALLPIIALRGALQSADGHGLV